MNCSKLGYWLFLRESTGDRRELTMAIALIYTQITRIVVSYSNFIDVFGKEDGLVIQKEGLDVNYGGTARANTREGRH